MSLGPIREHTPYFVVHLEPTLGKVWNPGNNRAGEENQKVKKNIHLWNEAKTFEVFAFKILIFEWGKLQPAMVSEFEWWWQIGF